MYPKIDGCPYTHMDNQMNGWRWIQRRAGTAANAQGGGGGGGRGRTGSLRACIGRATRGAPSPSWRRCSCRAPRARAARARRATRTDMGSNGPKPQKVTTHAHTHTHPHARIRHTDRYTDAFETVIVPKADATHVATPARATARSHACLDAAPKCMYLNMDGRPYPHI
jgi:hypothetical protein